MRDERRTSGRAAYLTLALIATVVMALGLSSSRSTRADDPSGDRVLRPMGPPDARTWADDSLVRLTSGGGDGGGKEAATRNGGGGACDHERKPARPECCTQPTGR